MSLSPGARLGPYQILAPLGAGGMGEVYRARDGRLGRDVAIKVLPAQHSQDPELRARFEREARSISQLKHPYICTLYDVGTEGDLDFLVMELLDGQNLAERLQKGPLPKDQLFVMSVQMADALDHAHRAGIVHRDLKPANVMLTKSGVKLLDFGLAKAAEPAISDLSSSPTRSRPLTERGAVLGTFQYMAPEQLEGKDADARSDIFSFGCMLYEMATGEKAFSGNSQASLCSAILRDTPGQMTSLSPPALQRLVAECLTKDPEDRWQSVRDLRSELGWIARGGSPPGDGPAPATRRRNADSRLAWAVALLFLLVALGAALAIRRLAGRLQVVERPLATSIVIPEKTAVRSIAFSSDGRRLAFVARDSTGQSRLWVRRMDSLAIESFSGTESATFPFWSPDDRHVAFFADGKLKRIDVAGGPPQLICDAPEGRGGSWNSDGVIVFARVVDGPLFRVSASGGTPSRLTTLDSVRGETSHRWPVFLPDGRRFLYLVANFASLRDKAGMGIYLRTLDSNQESPVRPADSSMAYSPAADGDDQGSLLFVKDGNLLAQAFSPNRGRVSGEPLPVAQDVQFFSQTEYGLFSVSGNREVAYQARSSPGVSQLLWFDRGGRQTGSLGAPANQANPRISPDGKRIALDITDPQSSNTDLWIYEASGGLPTRLTTDPSLDTTPIWSPDGKSIIFMSLRKGHPDLYEKNANGVGGEEPILVSRTTKYPTDWSRDGRFIIYRGLDEESNFEIWSLPVTGTSQPSVVLKTPFGVSHGQLSPDGHWLAYSSNESGHWELYVAPFPGPGANWKVSSAGGSEPRWRRDGKELFYLAPDGKLMAVSITPRLPFEASTATPLFQTRRRERISATDLFSYDVSPDGQHFLVNTDVGEVASSPLNLLLNWTMGEGR